MADGTGRSEAYGQLLIKAGVPLAVAALAALFYVRKSSSVEALDKDDHSLDSTDKEIDITDEARNKVILDLVDRINELQVKEEEVEARFERYKSMKEREMMVLEIKHLLQLETLRGECLEKEVSSIESQVRRMQDLGIYGMDLFQRVENLKLENCRLKKKEKKYYRRCKEGVRVNGAQKLRIRELEGMIKRSCDEVEKGTYVVNKMAEEISEFQGVVDELRREKMELSDKLKVAEASLTLKHESEMIAMAECMQTRNELEKLQEEFSTEGVKLVQFRWANAFLRRQLKQKDAFDRLGVGSGGEQAMRQSDLDYELDRIAIDGECSTSSSGITTHKKSLMKKPVEENHHLKSKMATIKANKGDVKSYGRRFSADWVKEHVHGREIFSSDSI